MNRFHLLEPALQVDRPARSWKLPALNFAAAAAGHSTAASTFIPVHYEPNYAYPLLVWLHGPADNELQLRRVMPHISLRNYVAVAPRGTATEPDRPPEHPATYHWSQQPDHVLQAAASVLACVEQARHRFHIADHRIFLAGYDCGGSMALRLALRFPQLFAGVLSLGGRLPRGDQPLVHIEQSRHLPVMLIQGRDSQAYSEEQLCDDLRLLHAAGMSVTLRQYPCPQEVTTAMLADANAWFMQLVTGEDDRRGTAVAPLRREQWN
jgi:phospholipase/carboxylesterase